MSVTKRKSSRKFIVLTTAQLRRICDQAEALKFSHGPNAKFWKDVDPSGFHVVEFWFIHQPVLAFWEGVDHGWDFSHGGGKNIRANVLCKMRRRQKPVELLCDFDYEAFMALPRTDGKGLIPRTRKTAA